MIKTGAELLAAGALRTAVVEVCGITVRIQEVSVAQRRRMAEVSASDPKAVGVLLTEMCTLAPEGGPLLTPEEAAQLSELRPDLVDGIGAEVLRLSGVLAGKGAKAEKKA